MIYQIIKNVIGRGDFDLNAVLGKLDTLWSESKLTDEQREELITLARANTKAVNSVDVTAKLAELENRVAKLERGAGTPSETPTEEYPEYVSGKWYYTGDKISFGGKQYNCIAPEGQACVWSPEVYPAYWEEVSGV